MCSRPRPMTLKSPDDLDGVEVIRAGQRENPDRWSPGTRLSGGSGGPLGTLGPVAALGPVRVLGAAAWVGGAAGETVAAGETLTGPGRRAGRAAAAPGAARPGRLARGGERVRGRRRRDGRTRRRDLPDHVVPGRDLVAGRGHARRVVQPLEFTDLAALHQRDDHAGGPGAGPRAAARTGGRR